MPTPPVPDLVDPRRSEPAFTGLSERSMLEGWLEFHRATLLIKCEGLSVEALRQRPVATSKLSLQGLVRHMAEVERGWFQRCFLRQPDLPHLYASADDWDGDLELPDDPDWDRDLGIWQVTCEESRAAAAGKALEDTGLSQDGEEVSLRWILAHMVEEYARHNGHADLIRELIDGNVGY